MGKFKEAITTSSLKYLRDMQFLAKQDNKLQDDLFLIDIVATIRDWAGWFGVRDKDRRQLDNLMRRIMNSNPNITNPIIVPDKYYKNVGIKQTIYTWQNIYDNTNVKVIDTLEPDEDYVPAYWGEIGIIYASEPKDITQDAWETKIYPNNESRNFDMIKGAFPNSMERVGKKGKLKWWIAMVPEIEPKTNLEEYRWQQWDELSRSWVDYENVDEVYIGSLIINDINYLYSAIKPIASTRIKFTK